MRHAAARRIVARLLEGQGFGEQAIAQALMASLQDREDCPETLKQLLEHVDELGSDMARPYQGPLNQAPLPRDQRELCAQLAPVISDHPANIGLSIASLLALAQIWPHVSSEERPLLRVRFLNGLTSRRADQASQAPRDQLIAWQRGLPTAMGDKTPAIGSLQGLLLADSPEAAYRCFAQHLDATIDLRALARVLGALAVNVLRQFHDRVGQTLHVLLGATALERLAEWMAPDHYATLAAQLAHQLWWCRQRANLPPIRTCIDPTQLPFAEAVATGDVTLAQRAARAASQRAQPFWEEAWRLLAESIARRDEQWPRALGVVGAIAWRSGREAVSPDDAAALATVFADLAHQRERITL
jgi:hypothetical protein